MSPTRERDPGGMACPQCGAELDEDAVICPACDHILDASFLEEGVSDMDDEDTDPRLVKAPAMDEEESTDPGLKNPTVDARLSNEPDSGEEGTVTGGTDEIDSERSARVGSLEDDEDDHRTIAGGLDDDEDDHKTLAGSIDDEDGYVAPSAPRAPPPPPVAADALPSRRSFEDAEPDYSHSVTAARSVPPRKQAEAEEPDELDYTHSVTAARPVPEPPAGRRPLSAASEPESDPEVVSEVLSSVSKEVVTDTSPRRVSPRRSEAGSAPGTRSTPGTEDSVLLDDYEKVFKDAWRQFLAIPAADKVLCCGLVLAMLSILLPWRTLVFENGLSSIRAGVSVGGWLNVLFAGGLAAILYLRNWRGMAGRFDIVLGQVGLAAAGLGWSAIAFLVGLRVGATAPFFGEAKAGPEYGVFISILAWAIVCAGAALTLLDGLGAQKQQGRGRPRR